MMWYLQVPVMGSLAIVNISGFLLSPTCRCTCPLAQVLSILATGIYLSIKAARLVPVTASRIGTNASLKSQLEWFSSGS